jgi:hypothetical protein
MTTRNPNPRNYRRNPHTASWLQKFHNGAAGLPSDLEPTSPEAEAVSFVRTGQVAKFAQPTPTTTYFSEIDGFKVALGGDLLTEKQAAFVISIAKTREGVTDAMMESLRARLEQGFAKRAASQFIGTYKDLPRKSQDAAKAEAIAPGASTEEIAKATEVPAGRYAVEDPADGVLKFYRLDRPTQGKWAGYTFLKVQASDELHSIRNRAHRDSIIAAIAVSPEAAATRYGQELGRCYACGRTLTDATSRDLGIGPDCRNK